MRNPLCTVASVQAYYESFNLPKVRLPVLSELGEKPRVIAIGLVNRNHDVVHAERALTYEVLIRRI